MNFYILTRTYNCRAVHKTLLVMKLIMIFLTVAILQVSANSFAQRITLNETNSSLEKVINKIRQQSGYDFVYNDFDLQGALPVTVHISNVDLKRSIDICLAGRDLDYEIKERTIIIKKKETTLLTELTELLTPTGLIHGSVIDANGVGLPGVIIKNKALKTIAVTNTNGEFILNVEEGTTLIFSYIGFKPQEVIMHKTTKKFIISMEQDISKLDEVSVEGYRTDSKRLSTSDITMVTASDLEKQPVQDVLQALEGRVPGMNITQSSGVPGARLSVEVRGRSNFDSNLSSDQPLFIVDGVPMAAANDKINSQSGPFGAATVQGLTAFAGINTADIESIAVLKDADATAIYGSRGANGVILITTKKGKAGKMLVNVNAYSGISTVDVLTPLLNTQQYLTMRNEAFANDGLTKTNANAYDVLLYNSTRYTDFEKLLVGNNARTNDAQVSASGGDKYTQYRIGTGYHKETTVWPGDKSADRASASFALNTKSSDERFTAAITANYSVSTNNLTAVDLASAVTLPPNYRLYDANGNIAWNEGGVNDGRTNPLAQLNQQYLSTLINVNANMVLNYKLLKSLTLRSSFGYNSSQNNDQRLTPISAQNPSLANLSGLAGYGNNQLKDWIIEPQIQYTENISKGKLDVLAGATYNRTNTAAQTINASGYTSDDLLSSLTGATTITAANTATQYNYQAFFGRVNYNWQDKYIVNFTGRRDGSSRFGPDFRFSNFGAVGGAWIFSNEDFLKHNKIISYGKLRGSYGVTGNDQIANYQYLDQWKATSTYGDSSTLYSVKLLNPVLHWEKNKKMEFGLEMGFFNDRVLLSASIYRDITSDPLVTYPLPKITGFSSIVENLDGVQIENKGLELTFTTQNIKKGSLTWTTDFNFTLPKNTLLAFPNLATSSYATTYAIGESLNRIYAAQYIGVNPTTGLYTVKDVNGDGVANVSDYASLGTKDPKFYGGLNNTFSYKRISLSFFFQFIKQIGKDWRASSIVNPPGTVYNMSTLALSRWQNPGDVTDVQKFTTSAGSIIGTSGYYAAYLSNAFYTDASFIRLKNASLSYTLSPKGLSALHVSAFKFYVQGQNLFLITPYKGADPETQSYTVMPPLRTIIAGLQLTL
ncbi:TonB-linked SusC/RagA family outer membrane protein [Mucilaginibacter gracilis]|uniref:TonB-linked SusC/RagA family outer membrane protein n=2 Tax=Mucilaginibacter gracilis TaxID=423350 RepID=A0A495J7L9_9SPHI|nr:TonB-linked SusC/RagA family outer membrane protein [Mucilaginibacter gracilis]